MAGLRVLLLAGGGGTRLWPLSSEERPKQFLPLVSERSLLAETCERLLEKGVLSKETHHTVVRLAPPLVIARADLDWALDRFEEVLHELGGTRGNAWAA